MLYNCCTNTDACTCITFFDVRLSCSTIILLTVRRSVVTSIPVRPVKCLRRRWKITVFCTLVLIQSSTRKTYLESLKIDHASVWRATNRRTGEKRIRHLLITRNYAVYFAEGKAGVFANRLLLVINPRLGRTSLDTLVVCVFVNYLTNIRDLLFNTTSERLS